MHVQTVKAVTETELESALSVLLPFINLYYIL